MTALPERIEEWNFAGGMAQHEDSWLQTQGFAEIANCIQDKTGSLVKAPAWGVAGTSFQLRLGEGVAISQLPGGGKLVRLGEQIAYVANGYLFALRNDNAWVLQGRCPPWVLDQRTIADVAPYPLSDETYTYEAVRHDCCRANDYVYSVVEHTWIDSSGEFPTVRTRLQILVTHLPTGKTLVQEATGAELATMTHPRIVQWGTTDKALLIYRKEATYPPNGYAPLYYRQIDCENTVGADAIIGAENPLVISGSTPISASCFDVAVDTDVNGSYVWVAYHPSSVVSEVLQQVFVYRWTFGSTTLGAGATHGHTETGLDSIPHAVAISVRLASDRVCVVYAGVETLTGSNRQENVGAFKREADLTAFAGFSTQNIWTSEVFDVVDAANRIARVHLLGVVDIGDTSFQNAALWYDPNFAGKGGEFDVTSGVTRAKYLNSLGDSEELWVAPRCRLRSKPFTDGERVYALMEYQSGQLATPITDANRHYVVAGFEPSGAGGRMHPYAHFAQTTAVAIQTIAQTDEPGLDFVTSVWVDDDGNPATHALERDPGAVRLRLRAYELRADDRVARAAEFGGATYLAGSLLAMWDGLRVHEAGWLARPHIEDSDVTSATPNQGTGTRYYRLTFARTNAAGELLRSGPSATVQQAAASGERVVLTISPYCTSLIVPGDLQSLWTEVWGTLNGQASPFYLKARIPLDLNSYEVIEWEDTVTDAEAPNLFKQSLPFDDQPGNELPNDAPPAASHVCAHRGRLWLTDGAQVAYSKEQLPSRPAEFSLVQTIPAANTTAIGPLGDMLAVFRERGTAYIYGEGPAANGQGSTLAGPIDLHTEHGCIQPAGVGVVPDGLLVRTARGLQLLNQGRVFVPIGEAIEDTLASFPRVRDIEWEWGTNRVWCVLADEDGSPGLFALLDLEAKTWSLVRYSFAPDTAPCSVRSTSSALRWMAIGGALRVPSDAVVGQVGTTHFNQEITTPWLKPAGAIGEMRIRKVWLLGENQGTSPLAIDVGYDYDDTWTHTVEFGPHYAASATPPDGSWSSGGSTPAELDVADAVVFVSDSGGAVPHRVEAAVTVQITALGSYPITVTPIVEVDGLARIIGEAHTFAGSGETRALDASGTVPTGGAFLFYLRITGAGAPSLSPTSFTKTGGVFELEALDALANPVMVRVPLPKQRCHAVRFRVRENILSGSGSAGFRFVAMRALVAQRRAKGALRGVATAGGGFQANGGE